jgi:hypothetical protein
MNPAFLALVALIAVSFELQQLRAAVIPLCEQSVPNTVFFNIRADASEDSTCMLPIGHGESLGLGIVVLVETVPFNPLGDPSEWSDILIFSSDGLNSFARLVSDGAAAFPKMRSDLQGTLTFIAESATADFTIYAPSTGTAPGGIIDNTGPTPIIKTPLYNVFSDPSEVPEPTLGTLVGVVLIGMAAVRCKQSGSSARDATPTSHTAH